MGILWGEIYYPRIRGHVTLDTLDGHLHLSQPGGDMLWTIFVILLVMWLLGLVTSYTLGGFIHILLVVALAVLLIQLITGRRAI